MGFQSADVLALAHELVNFDGVTGVWVLGSHDDKTAAMWITVAGFDEAAHDKRKVLRDHVENFIEAHSFDMRFSGFVLDYQVLVDSPEIGAPQIPSEAVPVQSAA